jgi:zinc/manganese transport system permease protein
MSIFELMGAPFAECLVLVAIHTYLGLHVLKRRVIFVDLALAQIAALGTTVGFLFGIMPETPGALLFSMLFTFVGAAVFCVTRFRNEKVPQEAVIGLAYAVSCAVAVMVVEKTRGAEHLKDILTGNLLWVQWSDVALAAFTYSVVGLIHWRFRRQFLMISDDPEGAYRAGVSVRAWDFLFYVTFGVVIALSTRVAGVLLVFVFLVAPAILALAVTDRLPRQLLVGWGMGTAVTVGGLYASWVLDLPSGPAVIAFYAVVLSLAGAAVFVWRAADRRRAVRLVLVGTTTAVGTVLVVWGAGRWLGSAAISVSRDARELAAGVDADRAVAASRQSEEQRQKHRAIESRVGQCVGPNKIERYLGMAGPEERLTHVRAVLATSKRKALEFLLVVLADDELPLLYREEASAVLQQAGGETFGYDSELDASGNSQAIARICDRVRAMKKGPPGGHIDD